jgi:hypothetical protein
MHAPIFELIDVDEELGTRDFDDSLFDAHEKTVYALPLCYDRWTKEYSLLLLQSSVDRSHLSLMAVNLDKRLFQRIGLRNARDECCRWDGHCVFYFQRPTENPGRERWPNEQQELVIIV